ncbi:MAG: hypothetical protein JSV44_04195 [Candidatus Zixiibacteriota bacterium]|nr:MAG: hypothetical protein JSV44_04195 [candidate division Zixibacteria bacterium]
MEIGISHKMLVDVGLNLVGFLIVGILFAVLHSLGAGRRRKARSAAAPQVAGIVLQTDPESAPKEPSRQYNFEFVDLKKINWNPDNNNHTRNHQTGNPTRSRQEAIRLVKKLLAEKRAEREFRHPLPVANGELSFARHTLNPEGAGRNS